MVGQETHTSAHAAAHQQAQVRPCFESCIEDPGLTVRFRDFRTDWRTQERLNGVMANMRIQDGVDLLRAIRATQRTLHQASHTTSARAAAHQQAQVRPQYRLARREVLAAEA